MNRRLKKTPQPPRARVLLLSLFLPLFVIANTTDSRSEKIKQIRQEHLSHIVFHPEDKPLLEIFTNLQYPETKIEEDIRDFNYSAHFSFRSLLAKANWLRKYIDDPDTRITSTEIAGTNLVTVYIYSRFSPQEEYDLKMELNLESDFLKKHIEVFKGRI